ncbi:hypothetical protein BIY26_02805 [Brenneria goodwinii]|uniref:Uncharacterized protein n=1 Tax=Brenneria goodwinii TaxID=1109412 RepID=A0AAE8JQ65_9GAMM|nr:SDR family NAD(P)-dependent oxidoreductase [Brenneria goodwinii]ATA26319.1 hypothetical protein AWC36_20640 [Brenneria goodwinii]RLM28786.1 hypothetical protein BIY26_02805 [Brenneria goodwinii]
MLQLDFSGKTAIVTGGLQGIGLAISDTFLRAGARVVIGDIGCAPGQQRQGSNRLEMARTH